MYPKILIVDDAGFMRRMLINIISQDGFEVVGEAENGLAAVELYKKLKPDAVTMDITMPEMDGITALKEILSFDSNAKIIICSAMGQQTMVVEAIKLGAVDFIEKPFQTDQVVKALNKALNL
ncbi:MAG: two-component system response regulator [Clostridiales bacterium GWB2_37_7]|nr:MAG: two-component system response regulator [Clostridiales bacterium GWB2_37_7]